MKAPVKGEPHLSNVLEGHLEVMRDTMQKLIFAYEDFPEEVAMLKSMWKDIDTELSERRAAEAIAEVEEMSKAKALLLKAQSEDKSFSPRAGAKILRKKPLVKIRK